MIDILRFTTYLVNILGSTDEPDRAEAGSVSVEGIGSGGNDGRMALAKGLKRKLVKYLDSNWFCFDLSIEEKNSPTDRDSCLRRSS